MYFFHCLIWKKSEKLISLNHYTCLLQATFDVQCGSVISDKPSGHIMSPGFPIQYDYNLQCNYTIQFQNQYINLEFISFDLEGLYCWACVHISILTHWYQNLISIVICRRPDFKYGLCKSRHSYIMVSVLCIVYNTHDIWCLRVNLPLKITHNTLMLLRLFSAI